MIIVGPSVKVNKQFTPDFRKKQALGTPDEYGNPFRIIRLRWNKSRLHKNTEYTKTRGFDDAVIARDPRDGGFRITYRSNGSVMWMREGGEGPYYGELAQTPRNMQKLASLYGDRLWTIVDADIEAMVKKMHEKLRESWSPEVKDINDKRIRGMHLAESERSEPQAVQMPSESEKTALEEEKRQVELRKQENEKRKAELDVKEKNIEEKQVGLIEDGVAAVAYTKDYLMGLKGIVEVRKICRQLGIKTSSTEKKDELVNKIIQKQIGDVEAVKEQMAGVLGGLDD